MELRYSLDSKLVKNDKSVNLSSRIDKKAYTELLEIVDYRGISLNSLINSIIKHYLIFEQFSEDLGLISLTKPTLKKIFSTMDDETIRKIAKNVGGTVPQELIYLSKETFSFSNLIKMIEISDSRFGKVKCKETDSTFNINILHGVSENFSIFLGEIHNVLCTKYSLKFKIEHIDNNMICMKLEKP